MRTERRFCCRRNEENLVSEENIPDRVDIKRKRKK